MECVYHKGCKKDAVIVYHYKMGKKRLSPVPLCPEHRDRVHPFYHPTATMFTSELSCQIRLVGDNTPVEWE